MDYRELVQYAKGLGLSAAGKKPVLLKRIQDHEAEIQAEKEDEIETTTIDMGGKEYTVPVTHDVVITADIVESEEDSEPEATDTVQPPQPPDEVIQNAGPVDTSDLTGNALKELTQYQETVRNYFRPRTNRYQLSAPKRPEAPQEIAGKIGATNHIELLTTWTSEIVGSVRPKVGRAPVPAKTPHTILNIIKSGSE